MSLNYLATRFTCTWPWSTLVMLCDGRIVCGCADPYGRRVLGDAKTASISGHLDRHDDQHPPGRSQRGRRKVLRRLPAQAPAPQRSTARPLSRRRTAAQPDVRRMHGRLQHFVHRCVLRARDRHHENAQCGHARLRPLQARRRRSGTRARADRFLQLRRGIPAQARDRDVRVHQEPLPAHLSLHEHERLDVHRGVGEAAGALRHR